MQKELKRLKRERKIELILIAIILVVGFIVMTTEYGVKKGETYIDAFFNAPERMWLFVTWPTRLFVGKSMNTL